MHRPVWEGILSALESIFKDGRHADKVIQWALKSNRKWGSQDRRFFAETVYDSVRWWRRLAYAADCPWPDTGRDALSQILQAWCVLHEVQLGKGVEARALSGVIERWNDPMASRAIRESIPDWIDQWGERELEDKWPKILSALNSQAPVYLRANTLKTDSSTLAKKLKLEDYQTEILAGDALRLVRRANVFTSKQFQAGEFEVQDFNSQNVAPALLVEPGQRVVDACAGAGGKTLHLAALMKNKGKVIALDVSQKKLESLQERVRRSGASIVEARFIENRKVIKRLEDSADRVLLDAPCSGFGVIRRNPDAKWRLSEEEIERLQTLQSEILADYSKICRAGGYMVYATCSIMPSENQHQVQKFLSQNGTQWSLDEEKTFYPEDNGADGFYLARLKRMPM